LLKEKDVVAVFSNGGFDGIHGRLLEKLKERPVAKRRPEAPSTKHQAPKKHQIPSSK